MNALFALHLVVALQGVEIPPPRGLVSDFAGVVDAAHAARIERIAGFVRARSGGEIAIVTMKDVGGREVNDIALRIGRAWGVGAKGAIGNKTRNAGVVILLVPKETASDHRGQVAVEVGQGSEGFLSDASAGDIWREAIPQLRNADYGAALELMTYRVAERFAREFAFSMDSLSAYAPRAAERPSDNGDGLGAFGFFAVLFVVLIIVNISRRGGGRGGLASALPWIIANSIANRGRGRGGWGGGGGGGGGGWSGGGGGFGGFGGGGGFSGGGSHGSW